MAKVTVVIPTCDRPIELHAALTSVYAQTFQDIESFVVDNGREPVPATLRTQFPHAVFLRIPPRSGPAVARNWGAMHACGDYIAFLDDDDVWPSNYLTHMSRHLDETADTLVAAPNRDLQSGRTIATPVPIPPGQPLRHWRAMAYMGSNMLVRRDAFWSVGGFSSRLITGEDRGLVIDLHLAGFSIGRSSTTFVLRNLTAADRLTDEATLMLGKFCFLSAFRDRMPARERNADQLAFLIYLSRAWRWPLWPLACAYAPLAAIQRLQKFLASKLSARSRLNRPPSESDKRLDSDQHC